ncbi:cilia and flagella-associated protein 47-like [Babylonia areolata]|uniref:cilia and flagella-associated protein 47-like n=1 Tax=Babylonia areolata TaxID=304850 RepID=UPI003FD578E4
MEGDIHGVRIVPSELVFDNSVPGTLYTLKVTVKNVAGSSRNIRYYGPKSQYFRLKVKNVDKPVASGLSVTAVLEYEPTDEMERKDRLVVIVDGEMIEVPIFGYPTRPNLKLQSDVDFGNVLATSKVIAREITLVNSGSKAGEFKIDYAGSKPIAVIPNNGSIPADSVQIIKVEFVSKVPGSFEETAEVHLEGQEPSRLTIRGHVAKPALEILSGKDQQPIKCIAFGSTYYGTDRTEHAILFNNGPEVVNFVAIVDEDAVAQELGVDLTQTTTAALAEESEGQSRRGSTNEITSLVTAIPNQGSLLPYQKIPIFFRFSPRWNMAHMGWRSQTTPPQRKDFALFVRLEIIGSSKGFGEDDHKKTKGTYAEMALTGTALPVLLDISPSSTIDFDECPVGGHVDDLCTIRNGSNILPVLFQFRRIAHFSVQPPNGKILPGQTQDVIFSFAPKQVGSFKPEQLVDVLGQVADSRDPMAMRLMVIFTLPITLKGHSNPVSVHPKPRFNPGITPYISNEVGMNIETTFADLGPQIPRNAVAGSTKTRLHRVRPRSMDLGKKSVRVAFPNDRAHSVRPTDRHLPFRTLFVGADRHQYVDPDYTFTDAEMNDRKLQRNTYVEHLHYQRDLRSQKRQKREHELFNNPTDIGIKSAAGLKPRKLKLEEIVPDAPVPSPPNADWKLLSTKELSEAEREALSKPVQEGLNAVPTSAQEKADCKRWLSPQELYQVLVGPPTIEFGKVCLRSVSHKELTIINNLQRYILVEAEIDCRELRQSSPLSQVVPPRSRAVIPIIFESSTKGNFQSFGRVARSVTYTINKLYKNHVTVTAEVVPVGLELSTDSLVLRPSPGLPSDAGKPPTCLPSDAGKPLPSDAGKPPTYLPSDAGKPLPFDAGKPLTCLPSDAGKPLPFDAGKPLTCLPSDAGKPLPSDAGKPLTCLPSDAGKPLPSDAGKPPTYLPYDAGKPLPFDAGKPLTCLPYDAGKPLPSDAGKPLTCLPYHAGKPLTCLPYHAGKPLPSDAAKPVTCLPYDAGKPLTCLPYNAGKPHPLMQVNKPLTCLPYDAGKPLTCLPSGGDLSHRTGLDHLDAPSPSAPRSHYYLLTSALREPNGLETKRRDGARILARRDSRIILQCTVSANSSLDCEVVWHPAFMSPQDGAFQLLVAGGSSLNLQCQAELGSTAVSFVDSRIIFGAVPVNLTTTKVALLQNSGQNHAYFQVLDSNPFPGLTVTPVHGVVPVGGSAELRVSLTPEAILKFDTRVQVAIKGGKVMELRMGGTVEAPEVDIDVSSFNFGGVYCGSRSMIPFKMINKGNTRCKLEFDLTRYGDFTLNFPGFQTPEHHHYHLLNPGMGSVTLAPNDKIDGELLFIPQEVAAYDFIMPVTINHLGAPSPAPTPFPPTPAPSNKNSIQHIVNPRPQPFTVATPRKHVIATALRQPLQLSHTRVEFSLPVNFHQMASSTGLGATTSIVLVNNSRGPLKWGFDLRAVGSAMEEGVLKFLHSSGVPFISDGTNNGIEGELDPGQTMPVTIVFCPKEPGVYEAVVPVVINEQWDKPYQMLYITGQLREPKVWFDPPGICLTPVPLLTDVHCEFNVLASQYQGSSELSVETPTVESEDGDSFSPVKVTFLQGNEIRQCAGDNGQIDPCCLPCKVTFCSPKPVSFTKPIVFKDNQGRSFSLALTATADNSILTCYPFLAINRASHTIVREKRDKGFMEAMMVPVHSPNRSQSRPSTSATSSNFLVSSSTYEQSPSATDSTGNSTPGPRDGAMNKPPTGSDFHSRAQTHPPEAASRLGSAMFPDVDSEEGVFHLEVLGAAQRWFSAQGWPGGPFPIVIPDTLRSSISRKQGEDGVGGGRGGANSSKKDAKTVYDMIGYLSGRPVPGIPINSPLPTDPVECVKQIYWQHATLLTFLRCQGACLASVRPEYLMTLREFRIWQHLQEQVQEELGVQGKGEGAAAAPDNMEDEVFEAVSKRAWTDILLQILKVLILARVTPKAYRSVAVPSKDEELPPVSPDSLASNVYSVGERLLLAWLNHYYNKYRTSVWQNSKRGGVPSCRWVVNFELDLMDGLVLGAVLGAHMPFLIKTHLEDMYTQPSTAEQCLHNALKIVTAMRYAGMDYDVQAVDITDPNPIMMLLLVVQLFQTLPCYLPKATMEFTGSLHSTVTRQVKVSNPSNKPLTYHVLLAGHDARDFAVPKGTLVTIPARHTLPLSVEFTSRYLRPAEATLVLIGTRQGATAGNTLTFKLHTHIDNITPAKGAGDQFTVKVESPCFELERVMLDVDSPFQEAGRFRIILVESSGDLLDPSKPTALIKPKEKKVKKVRSKIDHGQTRPDTPPSPQLPKITNTHDLFASKKDDTPRLSAFFSPVSSVYLEPNATAEVEVDFLPFAVGERQCSVIFLNETIGEFLYSIEAKATLPLPSALPYIPSPHSVRISSAAAAGVGGGMYGGEESVVYWKCETNQTLREKLLIPVTNMARERALILAAQQHMSDVELERRHQTGTLMSCSVTAKTTKMLATNPDSVVQQAKAKNPKGSMYVVEHDSEFFKMPEMLSVRSQHEAQQVNMPPGTKVPKGVNLDDGIVELPIEFSAKKAGHYPCQITLRSIDDIRVYRIDCTVNPEGSTAELQFSVPVHQSITQEIPIMNVTNHDWSLEAKIEGEGFSGPRVLLAKACQKTQYPLVFQPVLEREVKGKLTLRNEEDGQDHVFHLTGRAEKPLALEHIKLRMEAKKVITHTVKVPNATKKKLFYRVETDIPFVSGREMVSVLPRQSVNYTLTLSPRMRGTYSGIIAFIAAKNPDVEVDSDGDEIPQDPDVREYDGYRVWYSVDVVVKPQPPERIIPVNCACQKKMLIEVIVRNPTPEDITLKATVTGRDLSGPSSISLGAGEKDVYTLTFAPAIIGKTKGSLVFNSELVGEFWYELELDSQSPPPTTLPHLQCELGKWAEQMIVLQNPTEETLELVPTVSNTNNFCLVRDNERPIVLPPHTSLEVPLHFMPSTLGQGDHLAKITFLSQQLGEWVFVASGTGLLPQPQDPVSVYTGTDTSTTLIIPFRNPMDTPVMAFVVLKDHTEYKELHGKGVKFDQSPFSLLLKNVRASIRVGPKSTLDIPVSFAPSEMRKYDALCTVVVTKEDATPWDFVPKDEHGYPLSSTGHKDGIREIRWLFPVYGIPEAQPVRDWHCAVIQCQARDSVEQRLEVHLSGSVPAVASQHITSSPAMILRGKSSSADARRAPESVVVGETLQTADEFSYQLLCTTDDMKEILPNSVQLSLVRQERNSEGLVVLLFNIRFQPFKTMNYLAYLTVTGALGGLWKFPVRFMASDPPVDDVINVEASGLGKLSTVGFRLHSQAQHPVVFEAYFEEGSDVELSVAPTCGELMPNSQEGTLFNISFLPTVYGRICKGKLIIQSPDMQWSYDVRGVIPEYSPPQGRSSIPVKGPAPDPSRNKAHNYILENLRLTSTAVSSPIKGAPLVGAK